MVDAPSGFLHIDIRPLLFIQPIFHVLQIISRAVERHVAIPFHFYFILKFLEPEQHRLLHGSNGSILVCCAHQRRRFLFLSYCSKKHVCIDSMNITRPSVHVKLQRVSLSVYTAQSKRVSSSTPIEVELLRVLRLFLARAFSLL